MTEGGMLEFEKDAEKGQFRQELSRWFESRGIIADLRSHLRHLMITALQSGQVGTKPTDRNSPKAQALNLVVAEYLLRHGCHYTLSVFTSEVPTLANFNPDASLRGGGDRPKGRRNCFQEDEVEEILNALGMPSRAEPLALLKNSYLGKGNDTSLLELFLQTASQIATKLRVHHHLESQNVFEGERLLSKEWSSRIVDVLLGEKMSPSQITAVEEAIFRITETETRKAVEEERKLQLQLLTEREKRIQEHLRKHEEEIYWRLTEAEKDLAARKDTIEEELSRREEHLTKMAIEWNNKHKQILRLSKNFHDLENENKSLKKKLKESEEEKRNLREREENQMRKITELQEELNSLSRKLKEVTDSNTILSERIQVLISGSGEEAPGKARGANQITAREATETPENTPLHPQHPNVVQKKDSRKTSPVNSERLNWTERVFHSSQHPELNNLDLDEDESDSVSSSLGSIFEGVQKKLQVLEEESNRLNQSYLEYRLKCISADSDSESSKNVSVTSPLKQQEETTVKETKFCQTSVENTFAIIQKLKEPAKEDMHDLEKFLGNKPETSPTKPVVREPNKRQLHNRDFFLKSRQLLRQIEAQDSGTSSCGEETTGSSGKTSHASPKQVSCATKAREKLPLLESGENCLALLEETRLKSPLGSARRPLRQQMLVSESEEDKEDEERNFRFAMSPQSASSGKMSVGKSTGKSGFW